MFSLDAAAGNEKQGEQLTQRTATGNTTKFVQAVEDRAILADIEILHRRPVVGNIVGPDVFQEVDVVVAVEGSQRLKCSRVGPLKRNNWLQRRQLTNTSNFW